MLEGHSMGPTTQWGERLRRFHLNWKWEGKRAGEKYLVSVREGGEWREKGGGRTDRRR